MKRFFLFFALFLLTTAVFAGSAVAGTLYEDFSRRGTVKVYVEALKGSTGHSKVRTGEMKKSLETALSNRKSIKFAIVPSKEEADVMISSEVVEFLWTDHDPVDMIVGIGGTAMDAMVVECYARLQANFAVTDAKSGLVLWKDKVKATLTKAGMSEADSLGLINDDIAKVFIKEAFGKQKSRR